MILDGKTMDGHFCRCIIFKMNLMLDNGRLLFIDLQLM